MTTTEMITKLTELQELKRMQDELAAEIEAAQDEIKAAMGDAEDLIAGAFRVTYKPVTTSRLDTKALQHDHPDLAAQYQKTTTTRRFTVR